MSFNVTKITGVTSVTGFLYFIFPRNGLGKYIKESIENKIGKSGYFGYIGKVGYTLNLKTSHLGLIGPVARGQQRELILITNSLGYNFF